MHVYQWIAVLIYSLVGASARKLGEDLVFVVLIVAVLNIHYFQAINSKKTHYNMVVYLI